MGTFEPVALLTEWAESLTETVDGEVMPPPPRPSLRMESFRRDDSETLFIRIEVDEIWYRECPQRDWDHLNKALSLIRRLADAAHERQTEGRARPGVRIVPDDGPPGFNEYLAFVDAEMRRRGL
jgi:hypothetical protein